jgi:hypothetical protein
MRQFDGHRFRIRKEKGAGMEKHIKFVLNHGAKESELGEPSCVV